MRPTILDSPCKHQLSAMFLCLWDFPGENTGVGCHLPFQGIFPTQGSSPGLFSLLHQQVDYLPLHHLESPVCLPSYLSSQLHRSQIFRSQTFLLVGFTLIRVITELSLCVCVCVCVCVYRKEQSQMRTRARVKDVSGGVLEAQNSLKRFY